MRQFDGVLLDLLEASLQKNDVNVFLDQLEAGLIANQRQGNSFGVSSFLKRKDKEYRNFFSNFVFKLQSDLSSPIRKYLFGVCLHLGVGIEKNQKEGFNLFKELSKVGNVRAMVSLSFCYMYGEGVERNISEGVRLYKKAILKGDSSAMFNLGVCYQKGIGVERNMKESIRLYNKAIKKNHAEAMNNLGICYQKGEGVSKNFEKAISLYEQSSHFFNPSAFLNLGNCLLEKGRTVLAYKKFVEGSKLGQVDSMIKCFECLSKGVGVVRNFDHGKCYLQMAVENSEKNSFFYYGLILLLEGNQKESLIWFEKCSKLNSKAKFWFGKILAEDSDKKNFYRGLELVREANETKYFLSQLYIETIETHKRRFK